MSKKQLLRALNGNYGYVKGPAAQSSTADASCSSFDRSAETTSNINPIAPSKGVSNESHNLTLQDWKDEALDLTGCSAYVDASVVQSPTVEASFPRSADKENSNVSTQPEGVAGVFTSPVLAQQDESRENILDVLTSSVEAICLDIDTSWLKPTPRLNASVEEIEENGSASDVCFGLVEFQGQSSDTVDTMRRPPDRPSSSTHGYIVAYNEALSDKSLLDAYFLQNTKLAEQVSHMKSQCRKRRTDASLVRDFQFGLDVYNLLMKKKWNNDSGRILSKSIMKYLGLSPPWFTKAREVTELLGKFGPNSPNPDPVVLKRISAQATVNKGSDILLFLRERARAVGQ